MSREHASEVRFCLGTADLGMDYGIASTKKIPTADETKEIIQLCQKLGVRWIDTASTYGVAHQRIEEGLLVSSPCTVVTKVSHTIENNFDALKAHIRESCESLGVDKIEVLLCHKAADWGEGKSQQWLGMQQLVKDGIVGRIGVSLYTPEEAVAVLGDPSVAHIQIPHNLLDWRWREPTVMKAFQDRPDVTVHARSMLLQGLLVNPAEKWPQGIDGVDAHEVVTKLEALTAEFELKSKIELCIAYAMAERNSWINQFVVGTWLGDAEKSYQNLHDSLPLYAGKTALTEEQCCRVDSLIGNLPIQLLRPDRWPREVTNDGGRFT